MNRLQYPDYEALSSAAARHIFDMVGKKPDSTICLATGSTPARTYEILAELCKNVPAHFAHARIVKLDEWGGVTQNHPSSCEYYLRKYFIEPLRIPDEHFISFRADASDKEAECRRISSILDSIKPMDICVLGVGINGHLGFNEPAAYLRAHAHVAQLTEQTRLHTMIRENEVKPSFGYTLGMADLLQSRKVLMLVSGTHKANQLQKLLSGEIETSFPASFLWLHPDTDLYSDI